MNWNDGRVVSNFILQALRGEDLTIYGDGTATRSFQYVHDLVDGLIKLMASDCTEPVNLGTPQEYTIEEFARLSIDLVSEVRAGEETTKSKIIHLPPVTDDPPKRRPDITRAKERLGWEPKWKVRDGMLETSESYNKIYPPTFTIHRLLTTPFCSCILFSNITAIMAGIT